MIEIMNTNTETLVLGAGPAGLQLGYFFEKQGRDYLILERGDKPGNFFERMPRHRMLISINKVHSGYDDPEISWRCLGNFAKNAPARSDASRIR